MKMIQITAGNGPAECTWVVAQVMKLLLDEASRKGVEAKVLSKMNGSENGTVESALISLEGDAATAFSESWIGTIQWIGQSEFRKLHKRKNWFIGIFEVEQFHENQSNELDIAYQFIRSSGAGGQHINKVSSAVRATHKPTGLSVLVMDSRSQHQNKNIALSRLNEKLKLYAAEQLKQQFQIVWKNQSQIQRGNPKRIFEGKDFKKQNMVKNHKKERQLSKKITRDELN